MSIKEDMKVVEEKYKSRIPFSIVPKGEKKSLTLNCITGTLSLCKSLSCFHVILRLHQRVAAAVSYHIINKSLA